MSPFYSKTLEAPQRVRQIDLRVDLPPTLFRFRDVFADGGLCFFERRGFFENQSPLDRQGILDNQALLDRQSGLEGHSGNSDDFQSPAFLPEEFFTDLVQNDGVQNEWASLQESEEKQDSLISEAAPSLRRRLDAAYECCNRGVTAWLGHFINGLFKKAC